ncbi:hypothetical protein [Streptomyces sp. 5-10]|uniref:hypothetical protein n=1 Tax=Streptomyces sp. 5-10 TaxID=878925 RepID=UPI00168AE781|nr:hypothetical protein [Streptomyces sp. 5-10]MBD3004836.1 hypothetical protein [Streptomyces sp. 5-10]
MADVPNLADSQVDALLARALKDPRAEADGFRAPGSDGFYWFTKTSGDGHHSAGDGVSRRGFRLAVENIITSRGNLGDEDRRFADAYWDMIRNAPEDWSSATALSVAYIAPPLEALDVMKDW